MGLRPIRIGLRTGFFLPVDKKKKTVFFFFFCILLFGLIGVIVIHVNVLGDFEISTLNVTFLQLTSYFKMDLQCKMSKLRNKLFIH